MNYSLVQSLMQSWDQHFGSTPLLVQSPGRINIIGEHTDYNEGYVFPAAIDKSIVAGFKTNNHPACRIISMDTNRELEFSLADPPFRFPQGSWENYIIGVVAEIQEAGYGVDGFSMLFTGDIPPGAGMSSSAALENAVVFGLNELFDLGIPREEMILISQKAEHNFAGVHCGIMDQYASMFGREGFGMLLDCRTIRSIHKEIDLQDCELVLVNSNVNHTLAESEYNQRLEECQAGVAILREIYPDLKALRDITLPKLEEVAEHLPPVIFDRCQYVVKENTRVIQVLLALESGNLQAVGAILSDAHNDMRYLYDVSCAEIDHLVDSASAHPDVSGMPDDGRWIWWLYVEPDQSGERRSNFR